MARPPQLAGRAVAPAATPINNRTGSMVVEAGSAVDQLALRPRELRHDIRHQIATIKLLASLIESAADVGPDTRQRAAQILHETQWLDQLHRAYEGILSDRDGAIRPTVEPIRLDVIAAEVVGAVGLATSTQITLTAEETWARADRLDFWRALRNMVDNAVRAAGPDGRVSVRIANQARGAVAQVDDDGPGFGQVPRSGDSLGLEILQKLAAVWGGYLEIGRGELGGCRVRLYMRSDRSSGMGEGTARAAADL